MLETGEKEYLKLPMDYQRRTHRVRLLFLWILFYTHQFALTIEFSLYTKVKDNEVTQLRLTFCDPVDCSPPGYSIHGIFQARVLEWVAISFSRGCSWPRDRTQVSHIAGRCFTIWAIREASLYILIVYELNIIFKILADFTFLFSKNFNK